VSKKGSPRRIIVAMGGGGFSMEPDNPMLDDFVLSLAASDSPRICFVPTASGDSAMYAETFYEAFSRKPCQPTHLSLFRREVPDLESFLFEQDVIYVGGGNTVNMLAVWRAQGLVALLEKAWKRGVIIAGVSAGALCWFESGVTDSFGPLAKTRALGFLRGSFCPHYDGEPQRRPTYTKLVAKGALPAGYAVDDGAALVYEGTRLTEVVSSRPTAGALRVEKSGKGAKETPVPVRKL
jgi:dipeptidase E